MQTHWERRLFCVSGGGRQGLSFAEFFQEESQVWMSSKRPSGSAPCPERGLCSPQCPTDQLTQTRPRHAAVRRAIGNAKATRSRNLKTRDGPGRLGKESANGCSGFSGAGISKLEEWREILHNPLLLPHCVVPISPPPRHTTPQTLLPL